MVWGSKALQLLGKKLRKAPNVCSFHGDTLVQTQGGFTPIRDVAVGTKVWSRNAANGEMEWQRVSAQYSNPYEATVSVAIRDEETGTVQTIVSNRIHPYFVQTARKVANSSEGHVYEGPLTNGHWIDAADLQPGDRLLNSDGSWAQVEKVQIAEQPLTAFNLTVSNFHTYFVAANENAAPVWVHNNCLPQINKAVNSNMGHAADRAVERGVFNSVVEARTAYQNLSKNISKNGWPEGTIKDPSYSDRYLVPVGNNGYASYQLGSNGTVRLKTTLIRN